MSKAKAFKFKHNDLTHLEEILKHVQQDTENIYCHRNPYSLWMVILQNLVKLSLITKKHNANLIIDEAHAIGVFGNHGNGLIKRT